MKNKGILSVAFLIGILIITFSCKKEKEENFDRTAMLSNIGRNIIVPNFQSLKSQAELLDMKAEAFAANPDTSSFKSLQKVFLDTYLAWQRVEPFKFGPFDEVLMVDTLNEFPIDSASLEQKIALGETPSTYTITNYNAKIKGFAALDYLLFNKSAEDIVRSFTTDFNAQSRRDYLIAMTEYIKDKVTSVSNRWSSEYINTFINNSGTDAASSLALLVNQFNFYLDHIVNKRLGDPLGLKIALGTRPYAVEGYYSQSSIPNILAGLENLEDVFLGRANGVDALGLDDNLNFLQAKDSYNADLVSSTKTNFANAKNAIKQIPPPLSESIIKDYSIVYNAYQRLRRLQVNSKAEMPSALGVMISYTDNDGD